MSLGEYHRRRDFRLTPEPRHTPARAGQRGPRFVIQLHHARARHFDFRLEVDGVLRSWAVPKGPSLRPSDKRLAVQVEDHPLAYGRFEGTIPQGQYGGGDVRIVDQGTWDCDDDPDDALAKGKLDFRLAGEHLHGGWTLVRTGPAAPKAKWLLVKHDDDFVADTDLDALVAAGEAPRPPARRRPGVATSWAERALALPGARLGQPPAIPQLATLRHAPPDGPQWLHEVKWDGYRLLAARDGDRLRLQSRNAVDWTGRFPGIEAALRALPVESLLLDAELVVLRENGYSDFGWLQAALEEPGLHPVSAVAFDLLSVDGVDLTGCPLLARKEMLREVLARRPNPWLAYGEHIVGHGPRVFARAMEAGHEGILSKRVDSTYAGGRSQDWVKVKRRDGLDVVVVGFTEPKGSRRGVGSLLLALPADGQLRYVGRVGTGFDERTLKALRTQLDELTASAPVVPVPDHVPLPRHAIRWVRPRLVVEVEHRGWGRHGLLRQASFLRLRPDKAAGAVAAEDTQGAAPRLTHPDRVVYPGEKLTKRDVARYYEAVAPWLLPEVVGRPLSLLRAPDGLGGERFFHKHFSDGLGPGVRALPLKERSGRTRDYLAVDDAQGLLSLVQMNALEFHPWGVVPGDPAHPDRLTFDLDPGPGVDWKEVVRAATEIRGHLERAGLRSHALLSGGKGVHVVVPLDGHDDWPTVKRFARTFARLLSEKYPDRFVATANKAVRKGRIFVDWLRNGRGATSVAPWSLRARPGAPVALPVSWAGLAASRGPDQARLADVLRQAGALRQHPWGEYRASPQRLPGQAAARAGRAPRAGARGGRRKGN